LRHGIVYDASAWTFAHDAWLRRQRFERRPLALAFDDAQADAHRVARLERRHRPVGDQPCHLLGLEKL